MKLTMYGDIFHRLLVAMNRSNNALVLTRILIRHIKHRQFARNEKIILVYLLAKLLNVYPPIALLQIKYVASMNNKAMQVYTGRFLSRF